MLDPEKRARAEEKIREWAVLYSIDKRSVDSMVVDCGSVGTALVSFDWNLDLGHMVCLIEWLESWRYSHICAQTIRESLRKKYHENLE